MSPDHNMSWKAHAEYLAQRLVVSQMWAVVPNPQGTPLSYELERTLQLHMGQQMWQRGLFRSSSVQTLMTL